MSPPLILAAGGAVLLAASVAGAVAWLWADAIGTARRFGLREAAPGFAIAAAATGLILLLLAVLIYEVPRALGAL
jgi:hypothetical protein